jgi:hypothetical protein
MDVEYDLLIQQAINGFGDKNAEALKAQRTQSFYLIFSLRYLRLCAPRGIAISALL